MIVPPTTSRDHAAGRKNNAALGIGKWKLDTSLKAAMSQSTGVAVPTSRPHWVFKVLS